MVCVAKQCHNVCEGLLTKFCARAIMGLMVSKVRIQPSGLLKSLV